VVTLDLGSVTPSLAGPKRPQDRIELGKVASSSTSLFSKPNAPRTASTSRLRKVLLTRHLVRPVGDIAGPKVPDNPPTRWCAARRGEMESNKPKLAAAQSEASAPVDCPKASPSATAMC
jgi:aconitate hydratase